MTTFDALLCTIVANPGDDTPKLALQHYCQEELSSDDLADLIQAKMDLMYYKPIDGYVHPPFRNPCQAADDLRSKIKWLETNMLEDDLDEEIKAIEQAFQLIVWLKMSPGDRKTIYARLMMMEMRHLTGATMHESLVWQPPLDDWDEDIEDEPEGDEPGSGESPHGENVPWNNGGLPTTIFRGVPVVVVPALVEDSTDADSTG